MTVPRRPATASRRCLPADAAVPAASSRPNMPGIVAAAVADPNGSGGIATETASVDEPLPAAASASLDGEGRMLALIEGPNRTDDDEARDRLLEPGNGQPPHPDAPCRPEAQPLAGHAACAPASPPWDGGELAHRAEVRASLDDRLPWSLVRDPAAPPC